MEMDNIKLDMSPDKINVLDKGYVRFIDTMGGDLSVVNSARASYAKEVDDISQADARLIKFLMQHGHFSTLRHAFITFEVKAPLMIARQWWKYCYSSDTEVLTKDGWKLWPEISQEDELANVTEDGGLFFAKPKDLISYKHDGEMVSFKGRSTDLLVTPNHRMWALKRSKSRHPSECKYAFYRADEMLRGEYCLPPLPSYLDFDRDELEDHSENQFKSGFLEGFLVADASFTASPGRAYVSVNLESKVNIMRAFMEEYPQLNWTENEETWTNGSLGKKYACDKPSRSIEDGLVIGSIGDARFNSKSEDKTLLTIEDKADLNKDYLEGLLEGFLAGDGTKNPGATTQANSISRKVIEDVEFICNILGKRTHRFETVKENGKTLYWIDIHISNRPQHTSRMDRGLVKYNDMVYCAEVDTGILLVRRNGKVSVSGNCVGNNSTDPMIGWNENSRRYITEEEEFYEIDSHQWRSAPENSKQGSGEPVDEFTGSFYTDAFKRWSEEGHGLYRSAMESGIAPEQARVFLPAYSLYVTWRWSSSLQGLVHFLTQRLAEDSQSEIRKYATAVNRLAKPHFPIAFMHAEL